MKESQSILSQAEMFAAWEKRDASYDGAFCLGVKTTGIVCRPSCPSRPRRDHVEFFPSVGAALQAGYRPCKRCQPEADGAQPAWVTALMARVATSPEVMLAARDLQAVGVSPERARRWFQQNHGMTFSAWCRGLRLSQAFKKIRHGAPLDDVVFEHGFDSHSGFRSAFTRAFGQPPRRAAGGDCLHVALIETPFGPMLAAATDRAVVQLEFADRRTLEKSYADLRGRFAFPLVPGENALLLQLRKELEEYFRGERRKFAVPIEQSGTKFQQRVWAELQRIPWGETTNYARIARGIGRPTAVRAVARANASNRLYLLVPCHRVIGKDGALSGYAGGIWRKRLLLQLEKPAS